MTTKDLQNTVMNLAQNVGTDVAKELTEYIEEGRFNYLDGYISKIAKYKGLALSADNAEDVEMYADMAAKVLLTLEHNLVQEKIIADAKMAAIVKRAIVGAMAAFSVVIKEMVAMVAQGIIKGAVDTLKGEAGDNAPK